jgi:hypothetical protein
MFHSAKDTLTSKAAQTFVNRRIARYGEVRMLKLDSRNKTVEAVCVLQGEAQPIVVRVESYELVERDGQIFVRLGPCTCDRLWLQNLLTDFAGKREVPLPGWAAAALG